MNSAIEWQGSLVAAGYYFPGTGPAAAGYPGAVSPVVWTSDDGGRNWKPTWSPGTVVLGSDTVQTILATGSGLLLFDGGTGGSALWQSTDGHSFEQVQLPDSMSALTVAAATYGDGRVVAVLRNKYTGGPDTAYGEGDQLWTSLDGATWTRDTLQGQPVLMSITSTATGFLAGGQARSGGPSTVWFSPDGVSWQRVTLPGASVAVAVGADRDVMVAEARQEPVARLWWSIDGVKWFRGQVRGTLLSYPISGAWLGVAILPVPGGFVTWGTPASTLWFSATGAVWSKVMAETNSPSLDVEALFPDTQGVLAEVAIPTSQSNQLVYVMSFWQVTLEKVNR